MSRTKPYFSGEFRFPVQVQRPSHAPDGSGGQLTNWLVHIPLVMCSVESKSGAERYSDKARGRVMYDEVFNFVSWWRTDILVTDRLVFQGKTFNIDRIVNVDHRNKFIEILGKTDPEQ